MCTMYITLLAATEPFMVVGNPDSSNGQTENPRHERQNSYDYVSDHSPADPDMNGAQANSFDSTEHQPKLRSCPKPEKHRLSRNQSEDDSIRSTTRYQVGCLDTRLLNAIMEHYHNVEVKRLLIDGANPTAKCGACHITAFHAAACSNAETLQLLQEYGVDINVEVYSTDMLGRTPLHLAAWTGNNRTIAVLLNFPSDLQDKVMSTLTPEAEEEVKQLRPSLAQGIVDVPCKSPKITDSLQQNWKDNIEHKCWKYMTLIPQFLPGSTPLHIAAYASHHGVARLLLAAGADPNSTDDRGQSPLDITGAACYLDSSSAAISVDSYVKTIKTLIDFGAKMNVYDKTLPSSALHTAVEMNSAEAIQELLEAGAPVSHLNEKGNTPLHECVPKLYQEPLHVLANHGRGKENPSVDVVNNFGYTVLHVAIIASWVSGVRIALKAGASLTLEADGGKTAIHIAALQGNIDILTIILKKATQRKALVNYDNGRTEPPLFCAIRSGNTKCVQAILKAGAKIKMTYYEEPNFKDMKRLNRVLINTTALNKLKTKKKINMIIHATAEVGNVEMLELLFENNVQLELLHYECPYLMKMIPVEFAAYHNRFETFKFLLTKTLEFDDQIHPVYRSQTHLNLESFDHSRLLHIIADHNREDLFEELMRQIPNAVRTAHEYYPLHVAARRGHRNLVAQLIHHGADLAEENKNGDTAISLVVDNIYKSNEFLATILDKYINMSSTINKSDCEITVDYRVLIPNTVNTLENKGQMRVLKALLNTKNRSNQRKLLAHPLVESFLYLKWDTLSTYFYVMVLLYFLFVCSLSVFTVSVFYYKDKNYNKTVTNQVVTPKIWTPIAWQFTIYVTLGVVVALEVFFMHINFTCRGISKEFLVRCMTYLLTFITSLVNGIHKIQPGDTDWGRHVATLALVMGWLNVMILLSKSPVAGYYMEMFWVVSSKIIKILITFLFLILMFAFCFLIQFHSKEPFEDPWAAVVKTMVMMTSEFDYKDTFNIANTKDLTTSTHVLRVAFLVFLVLITLVLMNLTIGVAVHDVQTLLQDGNLKKLDKQVGFLNKLEAILFHFTKSSCCCRKLFHKSRLDFWFKSKEVNSTVKIKPVEKCKYSPSIKEAIMNKAQEQLAFGKIQNEAEFHKKDLKLIEKFSQTVQDSERKILEYIDKLNSTFQKDC